MLEDITIKQFKALSEFYTKENIHEFLDDISYFCIKEVKYLNLTNKIKIDKLVAERHIEHVNLLYKNTINLNYAIEPSFPIHYIKRTEDEIDTIIRELNGDKL
jgi:hypothetical protein